jgi:hypothetical protein
MHKIEVLGPNCTKCDSTLDKVNQALDKLKLKVELTKITDIFEIIERGIHIEPALIINS